MSKGILVSRLLHGVVFSAVVFACTGLFATTINVPADQPTIQGAINAAVNGDSVLVQAGTYTENINFNGKAINVSSAKGPKVTIIDGNHAAAVATFTSGETKKSVLRGFTLKNGLGGVIISNSSPTVTQNLVTGNSGVTDGGGILVSLGSPILLRNTITANTSTNGAGLAIMGASTAKVFLNIITVNTATQAGGGVELNAAGGVVLENNTISGNSAATQGGGVYIVNEADARLIQNLITKNVSSQGGGVYLSVPLSTTGLLFVNNTMASNDSANGSGVFATGFDDNDSFINNLIIGKKSQIAVVCDGTSDPNPPIFQNNDVAATNGTGFQGTCSGDAGSNGNIAADPLFVNTQTGNFQLQSTSPAIDVGSNSAPGLPKADLLGATRIADGNGDGNAIVDMGAYEFP